MVAKLLMTLAIAAAHVWSQPCIASAECKVSLTQFDKRTKVWNFSLKDTEGLVFNNKTLLGKWTVVGFGFTKCPDLCPMMMSTLQRELRSLPKGFGKQLQIYFVTLDPKFDTAERLKNYLAGFKLGKFVKAVTGNHKKLNKFARNFARPVYQTAASDGTESDSIPEILHSGSFFVVNPKGELMGVFSPPMRPTHQMFKELASLSK